MVSFRAHLAPVIGLDLNRNLHLNLRGGLGVRVRSRSRIALLLVLSHCGSILAADTNAVLDAWFAAQTNLHTWKAEFTQTRSLKTLKQPLVTAGQVWVAPPNNYRWELGMPAQTIALRRADELLVIYPVLKRAERYPAGDKATGPWRDALALLEAGFPRDRAELESRFRILSLTGTEAGWTLGLQPKSAAAQRMIQEIRLSLATNDFSLRSTELVFVDGSRMRNDFTNAVLNSTLDATLFDWTPPADFKVTEPLAK